MIKTIWLDMRRWVYDRVYEFTYEWLTLIEPRRRRRARRKLGRFYNRDWERLYILQYMERIERWKP